MRKICPQIAGIYQSNHQSYPYLKLSGSNPNAEYHTLEAIPCYSDGEPFLPEDVSPKVFEAKDFGDWHEPCPETGIAAKLLFLEEKGEVRRASDGEWETRSSEVHLQMWSQGSKIELEWVYFGESWKGRAMVDGGIYVLTEDNFKILMEV